LIEPCAITIPACSNRSGAPRSMKMGTIRSPWRHDAAAPTRSYRQICDGMRFSATPRGAVLPISQGGPVIPSIAAMPIDLGTDAMYQQRTHAPEQTTPIIQQSRASLGIGQ
jgi:hypothetical protein